MIDLPHVASRVFGTPLMIAREARGDPRRARSAPQRKRGGASRYPSRSGAADIDYRRENRGGVASEPDAKPVRPARSSTARASKRPKLADRAATTQAKRSTGAKTSGSSRHASGRALPDFEHSFPPAACWCARTMVRWIASSSPGRGPKLARVSNAASHTPSLSAIRLTDDRHHLLSREPRLPHCSLRIGSQSLNLSLV